MHDADVQQYIDFPLSPYQGQPVTLRQLMTHTAGFDETGWALGATVLAALAPRRHATQGAGRWQRWHLALVVAAGFVAVVVAWPGGVLWWGGHC